MVLNHSSSVLGENSMILMLSNFPVGGRYYAKFNAYTKRSRFTLKKTIPRIPFLPPHRTMDMPGIDAILSEPIAEKEGQDKLSDLVNSLEIGVEEDMQSHFDVSVQNANFTRDTLSPLLEFSVITIIFVSKTRIHFYPMHT